jgi:predicted metal-binding membrane protein
VDAGMGPPPRQVRELDSRGAVQLEAMSQRIQSSPGASLAGADVSRERTFLAVGTLLFIGSAAGTISLCRSMSGSMPMPGGWAMSMAWMRMPGQSWLGATSVFLVMWILMMVAMMLPSLAPSLSSYRRGISLSGSRSLARPTLLAGLAYFFVWAVFGAVLYPLGVLASATAMDSPGLARLVPLAGGIVLLFAGALQLTPWKTRLLAQCRDATCESARPADSGAAWRHGLRLGTRCALCCVGFMTVLAVIGVIDLVAMAAVTAAITAERLAPNPRSTTRSIGAIALAAGVFVIARFWISS